MIYRVIKCFEEEVNLEKEVKADHTIELVSSHSFTRGAEHNQCGFCNGGYDKWTYQYSKFIEGKYAGLVICPKCLKSGDFARLGAPTYEEWRELEVKADKEYAECWYGGSTTDGVNQVVEMKVPLTSTRWSVFSQRVKGENNLFATTEEHQRERSIKISAELKIAQARLNFSKENGSLHLIEASELMIEGWKLGIDGGSDVAASVRKLLKKRRGDYVDGYFDAILLDHFVNEATQQALYLDLPF